MGKWAILSTFPGFLFLGLLAGCATTQPPDYPPVPEAGNQNRWWALNRVHRTCFPADATPGWTIGEQGTFSLLPEVMANSVNCRGGKHIRQDIGPVKIWILDCHGQSALFTTDEASCKHMARRDDL